MSDSEVQQATEELADNVQLDELKNDGQKQQGGEIELDTLLDISVSVSVEIGRSSMTINQLINLTEGVIVELDKEVDELLDIFVNGTLVARGEVVVSDNRFGIKLVDIVSPKERLKRLK